MDWKRQIYIWQNSRRTNWSTSCVENHSRCHLGMLYSRKRESCWQIQPAGPQNHLGGNWNSNYSLDQGRFVFQGKLCSKCLCWLLSRVSLRLEVQHIPPQHNGRGKRNNSVFLRQPRTESRVRSDEPRDFPTLWWKICLLLLPGAGNPGEGTDPWYSQQATAQALMGNSSGKAKPATNSTAEQAGVPHSKVSNTFCLSCTVFKKIGRYL